MSEYTDDVAYETAGIEFLSSGTCPGCPECGTDTIPCEHCNGTGHADGLTYATGTDGEDCAACEGTGERPYEKGDDAPDSWHDYDPSFSWVPCDCCGSSMGGNRHPAHGSLPSRENYQGGLIHLDICTDCVPYLANGDEPDR